MTAPAVPTSPSKRTLADVAQSCPRLEGSPTVPEVEAMFQRNPMLHAVAVPTPDGVGLLTRSRLAGALSGRLGFGRALLGRVPVQQLVNPPDIVLPPTAGLRDAASAILARDEDVRYDDVLVVRPDGATATATVASIFREVSLEFREIAHRDPLTGLPNRRMLDVRGGELLASGRPLDAVAVLYVDLDGFKEVNDTLGHRAGDELLIQFARRLTVSVRPDDVVGRLGGDEFAVLLVDVTGDEAMAVADRIVATSTTPFLVEGDHAVHLSATVGVALGVDVRDEPILTPLDVLLRHADGAMLQAKRAGKARARRLEVRGPAALPARRAALRRRLRTAIVSGDLSVVYQPKLDLATDSLTSVEALVRWTDAELGPVSPAEFIPVAEQSGQVVEVGRWVLEEVCSQMRSWHDEGRDWVVAVNVSPLELSTPDLAAHVLGTLTRHGLPPSSLQIEITEGAPVADLTLARTHLSALRRAGVHVHLDDFGAGYSSLSVLRTLPFDTLKIDRSIISGIDTNPAEAQFVAGVINAAHTLGLTVVAEGVERTGQLERLRRMGCDTVQGYLVCRPRTASDLGDDLLPHHEIFGSAPADARHA